MIIIKENNTLKWLTFKKRDAILREIFAELSG